MKQKFGFFGLFLFFVLAAPSVVAQDAVEYTGAVLHKSGPAVTIRLDAASGITAGVSVGVYKFFTKEILGMKTSGWLHAAEARLISLKGDVAVIAIVEEKSAMTVNGKKVDNLTAGTKVKLVPKR
ncbi:MAG TPA: hypothetical protein PL180_14740 [Spirochaetota bacterium]|nr:hypothetical protein [Spirochaetota bacterium]HPL17948.1 hypothetical protein [Spirochaetota bacterium]HQF10308.1 hypothetical protein [Spirochaetota bacterium]